MLRKIQKPIRVITLLMAGSLILPVFAANTADKENIDKEGVNSLGHKPEDHLEGPQSEDLMAKLLTHLERYQNLKGRFQQTLTTKEGKVVQATEGSFSLKRPGLYRWLSDEPYPQEVVGNGKTIWIYDPDLEQVTITPQANMPFNPATLLSGDLDGLQDQYTINYLLADDKAIKQKVGERFTLVPVKPRETMFNHLDLEFSDEVIKTVSFVDQLGQQTTITFSGIKKNTQMADSQFEFAIPEGADVLVNE